MSPVSLASTSKRRLPGVDTVRVLGTGQYVVDAGHPALPSYFAPPPKGSGQGATRYRVSVDGLPDVEMDVAISARPTTKKATVVFTCGQDGSAPWFNSPGNPNMVTQLVNSGCLVLDIRWPTGWVASAAGQAEGMSRTGARTNASLRFVHQTYANDGLPFIVVGGSGATAAVTYPLGWYGLKSIVSKLVLVSGPTNVRIDKFCLAVPGFAFVPGEVGPQPSMFDGAFGYQPGTGPCANNVPDNTLYLSQGLDTAAIDLDWLPDFPIRILWGGQDGTPFPHNAQDWLFFGPGRPPWFEPVPGAPVNTLICATDAPSGHMLPTTPSGAALMSRAILGQPGPLQSRTAAVAQGSSPRLLTCPPNVMLKAHGAPVAVNAGTLLVAFVQAPPGVVQGPSGWVNRLVVPLTGGQTALGLWSKVATGTEQAADFSWTVPGGVRSTVAVAECGFGLVDPTYDGSTTWATSTASTSLGGAPGQAPLTGNVGGAYEFAVAGVATSGSVSWKGWSNGFQPLVTTPSLAVAWLACPISSPNPGGQVSTGARWSTARQASMILATFYGRGG